MDDLPGCQLACELDVLSPETQEKLQQWLLGLPKLLWQLGSKNPRTSHVGHPATLPLSFNPILTHLLSIFI
jgi:hypothetical protein